jgi:hypothetical protein
LGPRKARSLAAVPEITSKKPEGISTLSGNRLSFIIRCKHSI